MLNWLRRLFGYSDDGVKTSASSGRILYDATAIMNSPEGRAHLDSLAGIVIGGHYDDRLHDTLTTGSIGKAATEVKRYVDNLPPPEVVGGGTLKKPVTVAEIATIMKNNAGDTTTPSPKPVHSLGMKFVPLTTKASKSRKKRVSEAVSLAPGPSGPDPLAGLVLAEVFIDTALPTTYDTSFDSSPSFGGGDGGSSGGGGGEASWDSGGSSDFGGN